MKRTLLTLLMVILQLWIVFGFRVEGHTKETETKTTSDIDKLYAQSAVLMDADTGRVLFEKEGDKILPMASTTKIMTCILALEMGNLEDEVEVSAYAAKMPNVQLHIRKGEKYRLQDLLHSLMLESHNDSAVAIAEHIGGSVEGFAELMNQKAKEIGCDNTYFITPNGLDAQKDVLSKEGDVKLYMHSTTAKDLGRMMSYCVKKSLKKEEFLKITRTDTYNFSDIAETRNFSCRNHNTFLHMMEGALSGKTGFTGKAGYCYVGALERDERTFVVALLACGWPNHKTYKWSDTKKLMEYGISNYEKVDLSSIALQKEWVKEIPVENAKSMTLFGDVYAQVYVKECELPPKQLLKKDEHVTLHCEVKKHLKAPVKKDQPVGKIQYRLGETVVWERVLCVKQEIEEKNFIWYFRMILQNYL